MQTKVHGNSNNIKTHSNFIKYETLDHNAKNSKNQTDKQNCHHLK